MQPSKTVHRIFFLFYILILIFEYETIFRSSAWSFVIQIQIQAVWSQSSKKHLAELVFLYIDSILLRNQIDWLTEWNSINIAEVDV